LAKVTFTDRLRHVAPTRTVEVAATRLLEALDAIGRDHPNLEAYVLDEHRRLRKHVAVFVDGRLVRGQGALDLVLAPETDIYVMQALSGG
jgi:sulfur carrier protein ThiS